MAINLVNCDRLRWLSLFLFSFLITACAQNTQRVIAVNDASAQVYQKSTHSKNIVTPEAAIKLIEQAERQLKEGKAKTSLKTLGRAQRMAANEPRTYYVYGLAYQQLGKREKAKEFFNRCISLASSNNPLSEKAKQQLEQL